MIELLEMGCSSSRVPRLVALPGRQEVGWLIPVVLVAVGSWPAVKAMITVIAGGREPALLGERAIVSPKWSDRASR